MSDPLSTPQPGGKTTDTTDHSGHSSGGDSASAFTVSFRGYERSEVDAAIAELTRRLQEAEKAAATAEKTWEERLAAASAQLQQAESSAETIARLEGDLAATNAKLAEAEERISALSAELLAKPDGDGDNLQTREQFEAVLRVAEEQSNVLLHNATIQAERLLQAAHEEAEAQRAAARADAVRITDQAEHDAAQVRLKIDTEYAAHTAVIEREAAHSSESLVQAEREAETIRSEAEKGAAALRAMVARETEEMRADAEREVREMNARVLEFEETLSRRQDDAQQEFLVLHNQAVAHAERITNDANEQVNASLAHAQLIASKADDYEKLKRAQAAHIEAEANTKAQEILERARTKAAKIVDLVTEHTKTVVNDAEDRARALRWQQQQLNSFMAEVRELIRPEGDPSISVGIIGSADTDEPTQEPSTDTVETPVVSVDDSAHKSAS